MRKDALITLPLAVAALQTPAACAFAAPSRQQRQPPSTTPDSSNVVFHVDDHSNGAFSIALGSRKAKRRVVSAARRAQAQLTTLRREHQALELRISRLENPHHHAQEGELKRLKRQKLFLRDSLAVTRARCQQLEGDADAGSDAVVGAGGFADVYLAHRLVLRSAPGGAAAAAEEPVAVKVARSPRDTAALMEEAGFIRRLEPRPGFVRVQHQEILEGEEKAACGAVVMDLLGPSLESLWWACTAGARGLSAPTVLRIADGLLPCLRSLLEVGLVHRDIQPANILMGRTAGSRNTPHLIDFGIAVDSGPSSAGHGVPDHAFSGTPRFSSVSALQQHGGGNTAADDLESLCYTLAYLLTGRSPWSKKAEVNAMTNQQTEGAWVLSTLKATVDPFLLCGEELRGSPAAEAIGALLEHARACQRERRDPDYRGCHAEVKRGLERVRQACPGKVLPVAFDWEETITWSEDTGALVNTLYS